MAELVMAVGVPHNPLLWRTMVDPIPEDLAATAHNFRTFADTLEELEVDSIVVIGSDHIRQFFLDNSPAFAIGKSEHYRAIYENEIRTFGLVPFEVPGDRELADAISGRDQLTTEIDFAFSNEWLLDHGMTFPLVYLTPSMELPVVPIHTNTNLPPVPRPERFAALGHHIRASIESAPFRRRVALVTSGHLATDIGGPKQFLGGDSPDPEFDADAVRWMAEGDLDGAIAGCSFERVMAAGNVTYQFLNVVTALAAMEGRPAAFAEATPSRFAASPFFLWRNP